MEQEKPKIGIIGFGRMGQMIARQAETKNFEISCVFDLKNVGMKIGNFIGNKNETAVSNIADLDKILKQTKPDVVIDFSNADACVENLKIVAKNKINAVIGTTGFSEGQKDELKELIKENNIGAVISPNMSIGVNIFWKLIEDAGNLLTDYDAEIIESHHITKKDKPSGTALKIKEILEKIYEKEIPSHSVRIGGIVGEHTVMFGNTGEIIEIKHTAISRDTFAMGALSAAQFIKGKKGIFSMKDVIGL
ncbi:MAG: 4-hydroxy-tetrahydrodipicolinate reductase [Candidatus Altiarchaeales archaeon HGW-Altiarchaeales-1]|nr:MAG: 4-hydroxy-tetrahydrodipicolinate reductase [Candidatus Altiarchaeales archaeon HGW-Altiarchaeales-1]